MPTCEERSLHLLRAAIFDFDGTLVYSLDTILRCFNYAIARRGYAPVDSARLSPDVGVHSIEKMFRDVVGEEAESCVEDYVDHFQSTYQQDLRLQDGIGELLRDLESSGVRIAIVTLKTSKETGRVLEHFGLRDLFRIIAGRDNFPVKSAGVLREVAGQLDVGIRDSAYIGDRGSDVAMGKEAGMSTIAVSWGYGTLEELEQSRPDIVAKEPADVLGFFSRV